MSFLHNLQLCSHLSYLRFKFQGIRVKNFDFCQLRSGLNQLFFFLFEGFLYFILVAIAFNTIYFFFEVLKDLIFLTYFGGDFFDLSLKLLEFFCKFGLRFDDFFQTW